MPLMGLEVGGYKFLTTTELIGEFLRNPRLLQTYSWVSIPPKSENLAIGALKISSSKKQQIAKAKPGLRAYADIFVANARARNINLTRLSKDDLDLLATAVVFRAAIATDERALQLIILELMKDADEYPIEYFASMDVLGLLERNTLLNREQCHTTVEAWTRLGELLPKTWRADYQRVFGEVFD